MFVNECNIYTTVVPMLQYLMPCEPDSYVLNYAMEENG